MMCRGVAVASLLWVLPAPSVGQATSASLWQTARDTGDRLQRQEDITFGPDVEGPGPTISIASDRQQKIVGFGAAFTEAAAYTFDGLPTAKQEQLLQQLFGQDGIGLTVGRVHINSCDFSLGNYDFAPTPDDLELNSFDTAVGHDQQWLIPLIKRARQVIQSTGQDLKLLASPWSPPAWMKQNTEMDGSSDTCLKDGLRYVWANYISKWIAAYKGTGVPIWAITVQNEPAFAAPWDACKWSKEEEADFLGGDLGPTLERDHPEVKIFAWDHNKDAAAEWAETMYQHPTAARYTYGIALHWYTGDSFENVQRIHSQFPDAVIMGSEATYEHGNWANEDPVSMMTSGVWRFGEGYAHDIMGDIKAGASGWIDWNMMLDKDGGPNHVGNVCDAAVISDGGNYYLHPQFYYIGHFSKWVPPQSHYLETFVSGTTYYQGDGRGYGSCSGEDGLQAAAFERPDGQVALVVLNCGGEPVEFNIRDGGQAARSSVPGHAIQTYLISNSIAVPVRQQEAPLPLEPAASHGFTLSSQGMGCDNWRDIGIKSVTAPTVDGCAHRCQREPGCIGFGYQAVSECSGQGEGAGGCWLWNGQCNAVSNDCWSDYTIDQTTMLFSKTSPLAKPASATLLAAVSAACALTVAAAAAVRRRLKSPPASASQELLSVQSDSC